MDDLIVPSMLQHEDRRDKLEREGYLGNYTLTAEGVCHRTQVATRAITLNDRDWKRYLKGLSVSEEAYDEPRTDAIIEKSIFSVYQEAAQKTLKALDNINNESVKLQKKTLVRRWTQIKVMVDGARNGYRQS